jgi:serine/threonine protein phosphatase 1
MKTFVIADVHGCYDALVDLLEISGVRPGKDRLVLLGDYIDRGRQEHEVLALLMDLRSRYSNDLFIPLRGNHEQMALDDAERYGAKESRFGTAELDFMKHLPVSFEDEQWFYVHGGIHPDKRLSDQTVEEMLWIREECYLYPGLLEKKLVFGHTPTRLIHGKDEPLIWKDRVALDTGCVFGGKLSCLIIENGIAVKTCSVPHGGRKELSHAA